MPGGDFHPWLFVIVAAWILICGLGVVLFKNIMYCAASMVFCFLGVAFAYALLAAPLVAVVQILVYVGAISIVVIFAIMLTKVQKGHLDLFFNGQSAIGLLVAVAAWALLSFVALRSDIGHIGERALTPELQQLSELIFQRYVFPFELVSLVLVAAMVGAIVLATQKEERP